MGTKPKWVLSIPKAKRKTFGNIAGHVRGMEDVTSLAQWTADQFDPGAQLEDIEWSKGLWPGKMILKGILDPADAKLAARTEASGNRGLEPRRSPARRAPSSISALPKIADAVGSEVEVMFDGGIRSGQDVMRALALGSPA